MWLDLSQPCVWQVGLVFSLSLGTVPLDDVFDENRSWIVVALQFRGRARSQTPRLPVEISFEPSDIVGKARSGSVKGLGKLTPCIFWGNFIE